MHELEAKKQIAALGREAAALRQQLNQSASQKRQILSELDALEEEIGSSILGASEAKARRDGRTKEVKAQKDARTLVQATMKEVIASLRSRGMGNLKRLPSPESIEAQIQRLEEAIETEAFPFEKEQRLTKRIKMLKAQKLEAKQAFEELQKEREKRAEMARLRGESEKAHANVQTMAEKSQIEHNTLIDFLQKVDQLKEKKRSKQAILDQKSREIRYLSSQLKEKLTELAKLSATVLGYADKRKQAVEQQKEEKLRGIRQRAEEKLRTKKKLTTEDILALQA
ncbi:MAG TPA: hypothetical protein VJB08_01795 [Candidatus Nanoarchaeia archaeon]|nr:hypothetical protein [Candidatus Nanoarchaeia archaeon]